MFRILLNESLSSDAFEAFRELQHHTFVQSIRLTSPSWREIASTGQTLDRALWSNGWCFSAAASPLHLSVGGRGVVVVVQYPGLGLGWSCVVREVLSTSGVGTIRLRLYSGLAFCKSVVHTRAQIQGGFMLSSLEASHLDFWNSHCSYRRMM